MALCVSTNMVSPEGRMNDCGVVTASGICQPTMQLAQDDAPATTDTVSAFPSNRSHLRVTNLYTEPFSPCTDCKFLTILVTAQRVPGLP